MGRKPKDIDTEVVKKEEAIKMLDKNIEENVNYFMTKDKLDFFSSGCTQLDCVLGGGWAERRIFNVIGDKSTAKCLKNSYILSDKGFALIDDLGKEKEYGFTNFTEKLVITKNEYDITSKFWKDTVSKTIKVKTQHGFEIEGTPNHPILVFDSNCNYIMKQLQDITKDDVCVIVKGTNKFSNKYISLEKIIPKSTNVKNIILPDAINEDIGTLLGYFVADGSFAINRLDFSNEKKWFEDVLSDILLKFNLKRDKHHSVSSATLYHTVRNLLGNPLKFTARYKFVPNCILQSPRSVQVSFLRALIDCDSSSDEMSNLSYTTASEVLATQVQLMLLNLGIVSSKLPINGAWIGNKFYDHTYWKISMYSLDLFKYVNTIGSNKYNFSRVLARTKFKRCNEFDSIPYLLQRMKKDIETVRKIVGWHKNGKMKNRKGRFPRFLFAGKTNVTYSLLNEFINKFNILSDVFDLSFYKDLLYQEYHFDCVDTIEEKNEITDVFDVHIPQSHLFWSNGFISHNTLLAEEACINFLLKHPEGRIVYIETEAAFDRSYATKIGLNFDQKNRILDENINTVETLYNKLVELSGILEDDEIEKYTKKEKNDKIKINTIPTLVIVDSWDGLSDVAEMERDISEASFGGTRPKQSHALFRKLTRKITMANITLGIISQVKDNIGVSFGNKETIACKHAIEFWSSQRIWLAHLKNISKTIDGIEMTVGNLVKAKCAKNKVGRPHRICEFPVYYEMGINDLESNINWLSNISKLEKFDFTKYGIEMPKRLSSLVEKCIENEKLNEIRADLSIYSKKCWEEIETNFHPPYKKYI